MRRRPVRGFVMMPPPTVHPGCAVAISRSREYCICAHLVRKNQSSPKTLSQQSIGNKRGFVFRLRSRFLLASSDTHHG